MISNCGHDENGRYAGGKAGDQTGTEWQLRSWYSRPWDVILRCTNEEARKLISDLAKQAAENDCIGYDQGTDGNSSDRYSFWAKLQAAGYRPKNITIPCESDCSASTLALVKAAGYLLGIRQLQEVTIYGYTGNLEQILLKTGVFKALNDKKYLESDEYLLEGDILLCTGHHVCVNVTDGQMAREWYESRIKVGAAGLTVTADTLNLRLGPGADYATVGTVKRGAQLYPSGKAWRGSALWFHCSAGWFSGNYETGWIQEENGRWWYLEQGGAWPKAEIVYIGGAWYAFDAAGWMLTPDRIAEDGHIKE